MQTALESAACFLYNEDIDIVGMVQAYAEPDIRRADCFARARGRLQMEFLILAGGLLIVIFGVVVAVVSSVVSAVAAEQDDITEQP